MNYDSVGFFNDGDMGFYSNGQYQDIINDSDRLHLNQKRYIYLTLKLLFIYLFILKDSEEWGSMVLTLTLNSLSLVSLYMYILSTLYEMF